MSYYYSITGQHPHGCEVSVKNFFTSWPYTERFAFGKEIAPSTGKEHFQIWLQTSEEMNPQAVALFGANGYHVSKGTEYFDYVCKEDMEPYFSWMDLGRWMDFTPIQSLWETILLEQDDRKISFIVDPVGCAGKTFFTKAMEDTLKAVRVPMMPPERIPGFLMNQPKLGRYIFDLTRVDGRKKKYLEELAGVMEELKNGYLCDWRYKGSMWRYDRTVQVMVMCNELPNLSALSSDRWDIHYVPDQVKYLDSLDYYGES